MTTAEMEAKSARIDPENYSLSICAHVPSGERYILRTNSVWTQGPNEDCIGDTITACAGPLHSDDYGGPVRIVDGSPLSIRQDWVRWSSDYLDNQPSHQLEQDAEWANEQDWTVLITQ